MPKVSMITGAGTLDISVRCRTMGTPGNSILGGLVANGSCQESVHDARSDPDVSDVLTVRPLSVANLSAVLPSHFERGVVSPLAFLVTVSL